MTNNINYKIGILIIFSIVMSALVNANLTDFVTDSANVLTSDEEAFLEYMLAELRENTSVEMAVVTIDTLNGTPIEIYSLELAHGNLGDEDKDNGILILLAVNDREYRIEVGYGLEPIISASRAGRIGREVMAPYFKDEKYSEGLINGVLALINIIENDESSETEAFQTKEKSMFPTFVFLLIILIIFLVVAYLSYKEEKRYSKKSSNDEDFTASAVVASLFGRGGSGGFSGGSSGGFGGFGGGSFGGGGFSGKF